MCINIYNSTKKLFYSVYYFVVFIEFLTVLFCAVFFCSCLPFSVVSLILTLSAWSTPLLSLNISSTNIEL